jgi:hypothetical protein
MTSYTLQVQPRASYTIEYSNQRGPQGATGFGLEPIPTNTLLGNSSGSDALPTAQDVAELRTILANGLPTESLFWDDDGTEFSHVYFDRTGLKDTKTVNWQVANAPPLVKRLMPTYAGPSARGKVGPFSAGNQISVGTSLFAFPTAPWYAAVEVDHVEGSNRSIAQCIGSNPRGWVLQVGSAGAVSLYNSAFNAGPIASGLNGKCAVGRNTIIWGHDGSNFLLKVNNSKTLSVAASYTVPVGATGYIGSAVAAGYYLGQIYEIAGWEATPSAAIFDELYETSQAESGTGYKFPRDSTQRFHFHGNEYAANTWSYWPFNYTSRTADTLTTSGTVGSGTDNVVRKSGDSRYVISPAATPAVATADTSMYYVNAADNVFNRGTSWHAAVAVVPDTQGLSTTQIYFASGRASAEGGWQLVHEDNDESPSSTLNTVFIGSNTKINGPALIGDRLNIICFGWDAENGRGFLKVNDGPTQRRAMTLIQQAVFGDRRDQAQIAGHNNMDIGFTGNFVESIFRTGAPTDKRFADLQRAMLNRDT